MRSLKELAAEALACQDACNLLGLSRAFSRVLDDLRDLGLDTDQINTHWIVTVWLDKFNSLNGRQDPHSAFSKVYDECIDAA